MAGTVSGIAFSGGVILNSLNAFNADAVEEEGTHVDQCISHPTPFGMFHYHYWSGCAKEGFGLASKTKASGLCKDIKDCYMDTADFTRTATTDG